MAMYSLLESARDGLSRERHEIQKHLLLPSSRSAFARCLQVVSFIFLDDVDASLHI